MAGTSRFAPLAHQRPAFHRVRGRRPQRYRRLRLEALEDRRLLAVYAVPADYLRHDGLPGLVGSYVNEELWYRAEQDDWRVSQTISGTRVDLNLNFSTDGWGTRSSVGLTIGSDANWDSFSVQWDGQIIVPTAGTRLYTRSDDSSRMWIDVDHDGSFDTQAPELVNNHWGSGQDVTTGDSSIALAAGTYRIRLQYTVGGGSNRMFLGWDDAGHSGGLLDPTTIITAYGSLGSAADVYDVALPLHAGDTLQVWPLNRSYSDMNYAPAVEVLLPDGRTLTSSFDGHDFRVVIPTPGQYVGRISSRFVQRAYQGDFTVTFRATVFAGLLESEPNDSLATSQVLTPAATFRGVLSSPADNDYFRFNAAAGQTVVVKWAHLPERSPSVRLVGPGGATVALGMDGSGLAAPLDMPGTYYLRVAADNSAGVVTGDYVGSVTLIDNAVLESPSGDVFDHAAKLPATTLHVVPGEYLQQTRSGPAGLVGSYVDGWLGWRETHDDWRNPSSGITISGTRVDRVLRFTTADWGPRSEVGVTTGSDSDWELYSVQWDGFLTIPVSGTRLYTRSDDGSRMWIDINDDGVFASAGPEFVDNHFTQQQPATTGPASTPLAAGTYRIRVQFQEGYGANEIYLLWDDASHSAAAIAGPTLAAAGTLASLADIDLFAVDLLAGNAYEFRLEHSGQLLATQDRMLALCSEFGQILGYAINGSLRVDIAQSRGGRHLLAVSAATAAGLGGYAVTVSVVDTFPAQRDVPLYYFDFDGAGTYWGWQAAPFQRQEAEPLIIGMFQATAGVNDLDLTTVQPAAGVERVAVAIGDVPGPPWGGLGGGWRGGRRPSGDAICDVSDELGWTQLNNGTWAYNVARHEAGHGMGIPHTRHSLDVMSYDGQVPLFPPGDLFPFGENPLPGRQLFRERDYLDWVTQAGRYVHESENNDTPAGAQPLDTYLLEMSGDEDPRNDKVVLIGLIVDPDDQDTYRFTALAGESFAFDVDAAEFQSPLDATLTVYDETGRVLAENRDAIDPETGLGSVDPYLRYTFTVEGTYYVQVTPNKGTWGNYRLKVAPERSWDRDAPRALASWQDGGQSIDGTRQLIWWWDRQLDPAALTAQNILVRDERGVVQLGNAWFDPTDATLVWQADVPLAAGQYTVTLRSGATGIRDLWGNPLDGETSGTLVFPHISGDGEPGGDLVTGFTVSQPDNAPAVVTRASYRRHSYNFGQITLELSDQIDYSQFNAPSDFVVRQAGADGQFDTLDDHVLELWRAADKVASLANPTLYLYTFGPLEPGFYRLEGSVLDAAGHLISVFETLSVGTSAVPSEYLQPPSLSGQGLEGTYVNSSLRRRATRDDWRTAADVAVSGTRIDAKLDFRTDNWGVRSEVGLTWGADDNWEDFSTQWDGWITIPADGTRLYLNSDDGSRMWIDVDQDGHFADNSTEFLDNHWGSGQPPTLSGPSSPLAAGSYRVRIQYEEGYGGNDLHLLWDSEAGDIAGGGVVRPTNVAALNVTPGSVVTTPLESLEITFSGSVDPATLTNGNFQVRFSTDPVFFDDNDVLLVDADGNIAWDETHYRATFQPSTVLAVGYYLVELNGRPGGITDAFGRLLDGEFLGASIPGNQAPSVWHMSPSGDGLPGGDYRAYFSVQPGALKAEITSTPSGFVATFNKPIDPSVLTLYDGPARLLGTADASLASDTGSLVPGSLVVAERSVTFIATGGVLAAGEYTVRLRSADNGFRVRGSGELLDGDADGHAGGDFVSRFSRPAVPDLVISLPDFARGPGQAVDVPALRTGLPLRISNGTDVVALNLTIRYDESLLHITGAALGPDAPPDASLSVHLTTPGEIQLVYSSAVSLPSGPVDVLTLEAVVPDTADYAATHVLDITDVLVNSGALPAVADDALHAVVYFGETTGDESYSGLDAQRIARVVVQLDSGFEAFPRIDPAVIADINASGDLSGLDAVLVAREVVGLDPSEIPPLPATGATDLLAGLARNPNQPADRSDASGTLFAAPAGRSPEWLIPTPWPQPNGQVRPEIRPRTDLSSSLSLHAVLDPRSLVATDSEQQILRPSTAHDVFFAQLARGHVGAPPPTIRSTPRDTKSGDGSVTSKPQGQPVPARPENDRPKRSEPTNPSDDRLDGGKGDDALDRGTGRVALRRASTVVGSAIKKVMARRSVVEP